VTAQPGVTLVVLAKAPVPGRVKTRLMTELTGAQAAEVAAAALADTVQAALAVPGARVVIALDGPPPGWLPPGVPVLPQRGVGLAERIDAALSDAHALAGGPLLLVGMDTPQLAPADLMAACAALHAGPAVLGPAEDGGWWLLGLREPAPGLLTGVPMSSASTGSDTFARLVRAGLAPVVLRAIRDVDTPDDARAVARLAPGTRFAQVVRTVLSGATVEHPVPA